MIHMYMYVHVPGSDYVRWANISCVIGRFKTLSTVVISMLSTQPAKMNGESNIQLCCHKSKSCNTHSLTQLLPSIVQLLVHMYSMYPSNPTSYALTYVHMYLEDIGQISEVEDVVKLDSSWKECGSNLKKHRTGVLHKNVKLKLV